MDTVSGGRAARQGGHAEFVGEVIPGFIPKGVGNYADGLEGAVWMRLWLAEHGAHAVGGRS